jgi:hypothetical protein
MPGRLEAVVVAVLLVGADRPAASLAEVRQEIPAGSQWELVRGWKGEVQIVSASLSVSAALIRLTWETDPKGPRWRSVTHFMLRQPDWHGEVLVYPGWAGPAVLRPPVLKGGRLRMVGSRVEVRATSCVDGEGEISPVGELHLILKRVK